MTFRAIFSEPRPQGRGQASRRLYAGGTHREDGVHTESTGGDKPAAIGPNEGHPVAFQKPKRGAKDIEEEDRSTNGHQPVPLPAADIDRIDDPAAQVEIGVLIQQFEPPVAEVALRTQGHARPAHTGLENGEVLLIDIASPSRSALWQSELGDWPGPVRQT